MRSKSVYLILSSLTLLALLFGLSCNLPVQAAARANPPGCGEHPTISTLLEQTSQEKWLEWIEKLSGARPVTIGGQQTTIATRYSYAMFTGQPNARAFEYILEQVQGWYGENQIEIHEYPYTDAERTYTWKNLLVTIPGATRPDEIVILSAHLDSTVVFEGNPLKAAPGADDNASGVATLLEAARLLPQYRFERTIRLIWFTGEEQGMFGSRAYAEKHAADNIVAVINLDMFGYDSTGDRCFELHVGALPASQEIGRCFIESAQAYAPQLQHDFLTDQATDRSDHAPFWAKEIGAVLVLQNLFDNELPGGCQGSDPNPYYHRPGDVVENLNPETGFAIARSALAAFAHQAVPLRRASPFDLLLDLLDRLPW